MSKPASDWIEIPDPPWRNELPQRFDAASETLVRDWFSGFPVCVGALITGYCILYNYFRSQLSKSAVNAALRHLVVQTSESADDVRAFANELKLESAPPDPYHSMNVITSRFASIALSPTSAKFASVHWRRIRFNYFFEFRDSSPERRQHLHNRMLRQCWWARSQRDVLGYLRSIFAPPAEFTPQDDTQWLIAADMLEEAGEVRAAAIRAAVQQDEQNLLVSLLKLDPSDFLRP